MSVTKVEWTRFWIPRDLVKTLPNVPLFAIVLFLKTNHPFDFNSNRQSTNLFDCFSVLFRNDILSCIESTYLVCLFFELLESKSYGSPPYALLMAPNCAKNISTIRYIYSFDMSRGIYNDDVSISA